MSKSKIEVARVDRVNGTSFTFTREYSFGRGTFYGVEGMSVYQGDIIITDSNTTVEILFHLGGVNNIYPGEKVEVVGHREVVVIGFNETLRDQRFKDLSNGTQPVKLSRAGGVLGSRDFKYRNIKM